MRLALVFFVCCSPDGQLRAAWNPPGVDLARPRLLMRGAHRQVLQERVQREPYVTLLRALADRIQRADAVALDDHSIDAERIKARAAKNLAFLYAIDRQPAGNDVRAFASAADRQATGDRARELLVNMYTRSRLAVAPPLGGWDRDISTSEELLQYATAYDTLAGAGYDFGSSEPVVRNNIADLASELYDNYANPETATTFANLHQNNHRSKTGAALVVAAVALADYTPQEGTDPRGVREPTLWLEYGLDQVDLIMRYGLVTGDGAYAEGPFYFRFAAQNVIPFARAWDRLTGGANWEARGLSIPGLWRHPLYRRGQQWMLDMTLPDGSMAPVDDGNPGRSYYFGMAPAPAEGAPAAAWRWANAPTPYESDGNVDLAADAIVAYDDSVVPAPPTGSPTAFYVEGGNAILRSDWSRDAIVTVVQGEHDTASEFGRDRNGKGLSPESHEHAEPGSFLVHAFGERLVMDPGYLSFGNRALVNKPEDHNIILVDGQGPVDYLSGSLRWRGNLAGRPPVDGHATLSDTLDSGFLDAVTVTTRYGPQGRAARISRRFAFAGNRYLLVADTVAGTPGTPTAYTWLLHGNGGETADGTFDWIPQGGRWSREKARLDAAITFDTGAGVLEAGIGTHEKPGNVQSTHTVLRATVTAEEVRALQLLYPTKIGQTAATFTEIAVHGGAGLVLVDDEGDRQALAWHRAGDGTTLLVPAQVSGMRNVATDGHVTLVDAHLDGTLRLAWADGATTLEYGGVRYLETATPGSLGVRATSGQVDVLAATPDAEILVSGLSFVPIAADGACSLSARDSAWVVSRNRQPWLTLREEGGNSRPAADPGPSRRVSVGEVVTLDGSASCDFDGDVLEYRWELVSAPAGSAWQLEEADTASPRLLADKIGPYRVRLTVHDALGTQSAHNEVLIVAGEPCVDGMDNDLDGLFDGDDTDCDAGVACAGDCSGEGVVSVDELLRGVRIALGEELPSQCLPFDVNRDRSVTVDELLAAIVAALDGCQPNGVLSRG